MNKWGRKLLLFLIFGILSCGGGSSGTVTGPTPSGGGGTTETVPSAPTGVTASLYTPSGSLSRYARISFDSVSEATSYNIYVSSASGVTKTTGTKISNVTNPYNYNLGGPSGETYYFVVTAVNSYGESSESSEVSVTN